MKRALITFSVLVLYSSAYAAEFNWSYEFGKTKNTKCISALKNERYKEAIPPCTADAKKGDAQAQYNLATLYFNGRGIRLQSIF